MPRSESTLAAYATKISSIKVDDPLNWRLFNLVSWIVSPCSYAGKDGFVNLSDRRAIKDLPKYSVSCSKRSTQSIASFAFNGNVRKNRIENVINDLHHLGLGIL